jgi:hypothetical protein
MNSSSAAVRSPFSASRIPSSSCVAIERVAAAAAAGVSLGSPRGAAAPIDAPASTSSARETRAPLTTRAP